LHTAKIREELRVTPKNIVKLDHGDVEFGFTDFLRLFVVEVLAFWKNESASEK
jgi:hypothetical protein